jgi:DNA-binding XRE family transcriptional regulator
MNISDRFRLMREKWCLSQTDMASRVGVTRNTWQRYEKGELPNGETLLRVAELGGNVQWLLTGHGPMLATEKTADTAGADGGPDMLAVLNYLRLENARLTIHLAQMEAALQQERAHNQAFMGEAKTLLAVCISAVDHLRRQQLLQTGAEQAADMIMSMFWQLLPSGDKDGGGPPPAAG